MAITDLTGTTWTLKNALVSYPGGTYSLEQYQINIETSESIRSTMGNNYSSFESILIGYNSGSEENEVSLFPFNSELTYERCQMGIGHDTKTLPDAWKFYYSGTFTITGGTDVTNSTLITWLEENAAIPFTPSSNFLDGSGVVDLVTKLRTKFQQTLISGTNIKTINNKSLLGSGNISIVNKAEEFTGVRSNAIYRGECFGAYDQNSNSVTLIYHFYNNSDIPTSYTLFTIPEKYRPKTTKYGGAFYTVGSSWIAYNGYVTSGGIVRQDVSGNCRSGFGVIKYVLN